MKRRKFLSLVGAATAAPALPAMGLAQPSGALLATATTHAQSYPFVSLIGLSRRVGVSPEQAADLMRALSRKGIIGPINGTGTRPLYAMSKVFVPAEGSLIRMAREQKARQDARRARMARDTTRAQDHSGAELDALLAYLRGLCTARGMVLHPRCFTAGAIA